MNSLELILVLFWCFVAYEIVSDRSQYVFSSCFYNSHNTSLGCVPISYLHCITDSGSDLNPECNLEIGCRKPFWDRVWLECIINDETCLLALQLNFHFLTERKIEFLTVSLIVGKCGTPLVEMNWKHSLINTSWRRWRSLVTGRT